MRFLRPIALGIGAFLAIVVVALLILPFAFRDRIATRVKAELDNSVNARVAWGGFGLGLLRDFPNVTLSVDRPSVVGIAPFAGDTLLAMRQARLVLDLGSVVGYLRRGDRIVIREIALREPRARLIVLADGRSNWDITRPKRAATTDTSRALGVTLRDFRISGGGVTLDDAQSHLSLSLHGIEQSLHGDFARDRFVLGLRTRVDTASLDFAGVPYLHKVGMALTADVDADLPAQRFTLRNDSLRLNNLVLAFAGSIALRKPDVELDLTISTPSTAFRDILSLVPSIYARDFAKLRTTGTMSASGRVHGTYGPAAFPAFTLRAAVRDGAFKYPSLPLPAQHIAMELAIDNPGGHADSTIVDLKSLHAVIGGRPLDARLLMRTPISDPDVDLRLVGGLDLADVARTVELPEVRELTGRVAADVAMHARVSDVDAGRYDRVAASGTFNAARVSLRSTALPHAIAVDTAALRFTPRTTELATFAGKVGASDLRATGSLDNLLGFLLRGDDLRGRATVSSQLFALDEWKSREKTTEVIPVPPHVEFTLATSAARVTYGALTMANVKGTLRVKDQRVTLDGLTMDMLRGAVTANGYYDTSVADRPVFDVDLRLAAVDIPTAFAALTTVQRLAPVAKWAQGTVSGTVGLKGPLARDMTPVFSALTGKGTVETERLVMDGVPAMEKLANALALNALRKPSIGAVRVAFDVADGRVHVAPFTATMNGIAMTVAGSNGIDQTLKYDLSLAVPRSLLGGSAGAVVSDLAARAGTSAAAVAAGAVAQLAAQVTGTVTNPSVSVNFAGMAASVREAAQDAVKQELATRTAAVRQTVDSAAESARARVRAEAERIIAEAERQATTIRTEARTLAATARREANERADSLLARAGNPAARMAAQVATDRIRRDADQQAERIVREGDARAEALVAEARRRADALGTP